MNAANPRRSRNCSTWNNVANFELDPPATINKKVIKKTNKTHYFIDFYSYIDNIKACKASATRNPRTTSETEAETKLENTPQPPS
ncbi:MAG: hypothetical protein Q3986_08115 [Akkermansia sp.]|nr:hypothetical protein [Akkermansia sp.]